MDKQAAISIQYLELGVCFLICNGRSGTDV